MFDGTEATIDHTKSQVGYKSIVWFGPSVKCTTNLEQQKIHLPYKMDAKVLWPTGGLTSIRCPTSETSLGHYMVTGQKSVVIETSFP